MLAVISGWLKEQNKGGYAKLRASPPLEENRRSAQSKLIQASIKKRSVMTSRGHSRMRFITHTNRACVKNKMIQSSSSQQRQLKQLKGEKIFSVKTESTLPMYRTMSQEQLRKILKSAKTTLVLHHLFKAYRTSMSAENSKNFKCPGEPQSSKKAGSSRHSDSDSESDHR